MLNLQIFAIFLLAFTIGGTSALQAVECRDGKLFGVQELVESVEKTVEKCSNATSSKSDLFSCVFTELDMDGKPTIAKVKGFFEKLFSNKIMGAAKDLTERLMKCAASYAQSFSSNEGDRGKAGEAFSSCFFDATKRFTYYVSTECTGTTTAAPSS